MAINPVAASAAASNAQASAAVAVAQAKAANQSVLVSGAAPDVQTDNPALQAPAAKPAVNTNGQTIGTTINVTA